MPQQNASRLLIIVVLAILLGIMWFAWQSIDALPIKIQQRMETVQLEENNQVVQWVQLELQRIEQEIRALLPSDTLWLENKNFRDLTRHPLLIALFSLDSMGILQYPTPPYTLQDSAFLQRTALLWSEQARIDASGVPEDQQFLSYKVKNKPVVLQVARNKAHGWIPWFWEDGLHLLYWQRTANGIAGMEVDRIALLSRLIGAFPEREELGRMVLRDEAGRLIHQFGDSEKKATYERLGAQPLPFPLQGWVVEFWTDVVAMKSNLAWKEWMQLLWRILLPAMVVLFLGLWLYRELSRSLREARARVDFVNQVSHELKTPLTNIRLYAELLESKVEEKDQEKLRIIQSESERLSRMILNILTFSRNEKRKLQLGKIPVDLYELVVETVDIFQLRMEKRGLKVDIQGRLSKGVSLDPDATRQILANLIGNAEKYAAQGERILIELSQSEEWTRIVVQDYGPGIPPHLQEKVFEPFFRMSDRLEEGVSGTGIGLHIARTLAELQSGSLTIEPSEVGARFVWRIQS